MPERRARATLAVAGLVLLTTALARAEERILSFESDVTVQPNAVLRVQERIRVVAENQQIRHGIYRDFPTIYRNADGSSHRVGFTIDEVTRNGAPEPYHLAGLINGLRVYVGRKDAFVSPGEHVYTITYRTDRQIGFFPDHDELYWNVNGNGWIFPVDEVAATVHLPAGIEAPDIRVAGYTGREGSREAALESAVHDGGVVDFRTTRALGPREGLTIVVGWPKGRVRPPTAEARALFWLRDHRLPAYLIGGFAAVFLYLFFAWLRVGRDRPGGTIVPLFEPPPGLSPAAVRFIRRMGFDQKTFSAALINMAVKGALKIEDKSGLIPLLSKDTYRLTKEKDDADLAPEEAGAFAELLALGEIDLQQKNYERIQRSIAALKSALTAQYETRNFAVNGGHTIVGGLLAAAIAFVSFPIGATDPWAAIEFIVFILAVGILLATFYRLMKAPTARGRELWDKIDGFKLYLSLAEKERLAVLNPPEKTPELFEKYLPFALALDVEQKWAEQFTDVLARAAVDPQTGRTRQPSWYSGQAWNPRHPVGFANAMGAALTSAVASSSASPGSSSGFGGGSGGGGGGGGGGGW